MSFSVNNPKKGSMVQTNLTKEYQKLQCDYLWISSEQEKLREKNENKYVAVKNKKVVLADTDIFRLLTTLKAQGYKVDDFAIEYISECPSCLLL
jgi:hypothetical protein